MNRNYDVIVIGAGAAGMIASVNAAEKGYSVLLLEKADHPGRKILASGNGRCNMMNSGMLRYYGDAEFAHEVLSHCSRKELTCFFNHYGLMMTSDDEDRIYPMTFQSSSVLAVLKNAMELNGVNLRLNSSVQSVHVEKDQFAVKISNENTFLSKKLIVACGGAAQPKLGGTYDGYYILESMGHKLLPVCPALVSLNTDAKSRSGLSGIRIRCGVSVCRNTDILHKESGEVLFTEYGISGICIMQCARFANQNGSYIYLDLFQNVFPSKNDAAAELKRRKKLFPFNSPVWLLNGILPEKVSYAVLKQADIAMRGERIQDISDCMIEKIIETAYRYKIIISGTRGFDYAQVTAGGIDCRDFNPRTMESRIIKGLYAAGEILNVDGDCGGFNLMFAFASGMTAGKSV